MSFLKIIVLNLLLTNICFAQRPEILTLLRFNTNSSSNDLYMGDFATDQSGNIYITGRFKGQMDLDPGVGVTMGVAHRNNYASFLIKTDSLGVFIWGNVFKDPTNSTLHGESSISSVVIDENNNVYVCGTFTLLIDFIDDGNTQYHLTTTSGDKGAFVAKFSENGIYRWSKKVISDTNIFASEILYDNAGFLYVPYNFGGIASYPNPNILTTINAISGEDILIQKMDTNGLVVWHKHIGGAGNEEVYNIFLTPSKELYVSGHYDLSLIDPSNNTTLENSLGFRDIFLLKLNSQGVIQISESIGGFGDERCFGLDFDTLRNRVYLSGSYSGTVDFDISPGVFNLQSRGMDDAFLASYDISMNFNWVQSFGGSDSDLSYDVTLNNKTGDLYNTGRSRSTPYILIDNGIDSLRSYGSSDIVYQKISFNGKLLQSNNFGSIGFELTYQIVPISQDRVWLRGQYDRDISLDRFDSSSFIPRSNGGGRQAFLLLFRNVEPAIDSLSVSACNSFVYNGTNYFDQSVSFVDTLYRNGALDSLRYVDIQINAIEDSIAYQNGILSALDSNLTYQWYSCDSAKNIVGNTSRYFKPTYNGSFALIVSDSNCTDTSSCFLVSDVSLQEKGVLNPNISIFPNPTSGKITVQSNNGLRIEQVDVLTLSGQLLSSIKNANQIEMSSFKPSVYFLRIKTSQGVLIRKVIKQ